MSGCDIPECPFETPHKHVGHTLVYEEVRDMVDLTALDPAIAAFVKVAMVLDTLGSDGERARVLLNAALRHAPGLLSDDELWQLVQRAKKL